MDNQRPKIKVPYQPLDIIVELINITLLLLIVGYTSMMYFDLPDTIATHFNAQGEADDFGNKATIWILVGVSIAMYILLFFINKIPHKHNYMVNITEENALKNYRLSTRLIRFTNTFCLIIFGAIVFDIINMAKGNASKILGTPFLIICLVLPALGLILMLYYQKKINR